MSNIPAPELITQQISRRAVEIARIIGPSKTGKGLTGLNAFWQTGVVGIKVSENAQYMIDVDSGIQEHEMDDLAGRIIPIRGPSGSITFRRASANKIGVVPIINRIAKDGRLYSDKPAWVYPAKDGLNFLQRSIQMSVDEWVRTAKTENIISMLMQTEVRDDLSLFLYGKEMA